MRLLLIAANSIQTGVLPFSAQCETNYASSRFIAEFINTLSNIPFIALGAYGAYKMRKTGAPWRYAATMAGIAGIGLGSAGFHATVRADR